MWPEKKRPQRALRRSASWVLPLRASPSTRPGGSDKLYNYNSAQCSGIISKCLRTHYLSTKRMPPPRISMQRQLWYLLLYDE